MKIPDKVRKCVFFLGAKKCDGTYAFVGTALLVAKLFDVNNEKIVIAYLVTAKHVIKGVREQLLCDEVDIRFNLKNGTAEWFKSKCENWRPHPNASVDVAVLRLKWMDADMDCMAYPFDEILTQEAAYQKGVGLGDPVFMTGLFWPHVGQTKSIPIIRTGNIAAMPEEPVNTQELGKIEAYLIEIRSIAGISGSPVFAYWRDLHPDNGSSPARIDNSPSGNQPDNDFRLLGIIHGHFDTPDKRERNYIEKSGDSQEINVGIAMTIPGDQIIETLSQSELIRQEEEELKGLRASALRLHKADDLQLT